MKKALVFYRMLFMGLPLFFSSLHAKKQPMKIRYQLFAMWSISFLKFARTKVKTKNQNYVPLKDGMLYILKQTSSIDESMLALSVPSPISFILEKPKRFWFVSLSWMKLMSSAILTKQLNPDIFNQSDNLVYIYDHKHGINKAVIQLATAAKLPIICIVANNANHVLDQQVKSKVEVVVEFALPLVYEEYCQLELNDIIDQCQKLCNGEQL